MKYNKKTRAKSDQDSNSTAIHETNIMTHVQPDHIDNSGFNQTKVRINRKGYHDKALNMTKSRDVRKRKM